MREVKRKKFGTMGGSAGGTGTGSQENGSKRKAKKSWKACMIV
jgi:hypothetical protein